MRDELIKHVLFFAVLVAAVLQAYSIVVGFLDFVMVLLIPLTAFAFSKLLRAIKTKTILHSLATVSALALLLYAYLDYAQKASELHPVIGVFFVIWTFIVVSLFMSTMLAAFTRPDKAASFLSVTQALLWNVRNY